MAGYWIDGRAEPTPGLDSGTRIGRNLLEGLFIGRSPGESGRGGGILIKLGGNQGKVGG